MAQKRSRTLSGEDRRELLRTMLRIREFENGVAEGHLRSLTAGSMFHLSVGEEAVATGVVRAMVPGDYFTTHHRGHGIFLARGADPTRMFAEVFGRTTGYCRGKGGSMHIADIRLGHMGANAIVGANIPIALGGGFAVKYQGKPQVSVAFFGDGALNQGVLYESMNMAALWDLPVVFVVVNNQYGMGTRIDRASASLEFARRAETFGLKSTEVDGMDVEAVFDVADEIISHARDGGGPGFIVGNCYRFYGHGRKDPSPYRSKDEEEHWKHRDPVILLKDRLAQENILAEGEYEQMEQEVIEEMEKAMKSASEAPEPEPKEVYTDLYVQEW